MRIARREFEDKSPKGMAFHYSSLREAIKKIFSDELSNSKRVRSAVMGAVSP
jgi:hypothetical protein